MSFVPKTINPDLQKERDNATFNTEDFALWWHGGAKNLKFKRELEAYMLNDMPEDIALMCCKSQVDIYSIAVKDALRVAKKLRKFQEERNPGGNDIWPVKYYAPECLKCMPVGYTIAAQQNLFIKAIRDQGTDEQFEKFGKRAENLKIFCSFAQTELGHGTFLRRLQSRADFDRNTDEFVLNTPTLTSYKWWPGSLGHTANYCVVVANLYIDNDCKGVAMFIVQLRDEETHLPLSGVDVGDIGHRIAFHGANNGFLGLKNVRIPRTNMLMRNAQVLPDGTYIKNSLPVLTYFTMVYVRCFIVGNSAEMLSAAATIATRYSAVRRQSPINDNEPEPQIIDHVTQQMKLFPEIATSIAYKLSYLKLCSLYEQTSDDIRRGEYSRLPEVHALACALKVLSSSNSSRGIECSRLACGGHGYLTSSNLGNLYLLATASCTYEGENTVLLLQVGRFLIKSFRQAMEGESLAPSAAYLQDTIRNPEFGKWTGTWQNIVKAFQYTAANKTRLAFENITERLKAGQTEGQAANNTGIEFTQAAELHGLAFNVATFLEEVTGTQALLRNSALNKVLEQLLELYLVHLTLKHMNDILRFINISDDDLRSLQKRLEQALTAIRPNAVAICDGFDFHDGFLSSTLGSYDGNVYERLFESAKKSPLNKDPVPQIFHTHLKPFMQSKI